MPAVPPGAIAGSGRIASPSSEGALFPSDEKHHDADGDRRDDERDEPDLDRGDAAYSPVEQAIRLALHNP